MKNLQHYIDNRNQWNSFFPNSKQITFPLDQRTVNDPVYRYGIAEAEYFHKSIEKSRTVYSIMDTAKEKPITERVNMPSHCSPSSESFWSM